MEQSDPRLREKCIHEAGHAVFEVLHGSTPERVEIAAAGKDSRVVPGWRNHSCDAEGTARRDRSSQAASKAVIITYYAGAAAMWWRCRTEDLETDLVYDSSSGRVLGSGFTGHSTDDDYALELASRMWPRNWREQCRKLLARTKRIVQQVYVWSAVTELGEALHEHRALQRADLWSLPQLAAAAKTFRVSQPPTWAPPLWHWTTPAGRWPRETTHG